MTWLDEHGVLHLVHQLPQEVWEKLEESSKSMFGIIGPMNDMTISTPDATIIGKVSIKRTEYPRFQTYCGQPRHEAGTNETAPTCIECVKIDALIGSLAERGIPWWR